MCDIMTRSVDSTTGVRLLTRCFTLCSCLSTTIRFYVVSPNNSAAVLSAVLHSLTQYLQTNATLCWYCHHGIVRPLVADGRNGL